MPLGYLEFSRVFGGKPCSCARRRPRRPVLAPARVRIRVWAWVRVQTAPMRPSSFWTRPSRATARRFSLEAGEDIGYVLDPTRCALCLFLETGDYLQRIRAQRTKQFLS